MLLPVVRERLDKLLRLAPVDGALTALRMGDGQVSLSGLQPNAKALLAAFFAGELRRPAFYVVSSNKQAEALADTIRFFASVFSAGSVAVLPAFDTLPWDARGPHADILERRAATLFQVASGQAQILIAPISAALWRYRPYYTYESLTRTLKPDDEVSLDGFISHLASVGYARTEMVEMPGQFAQRGGIVDLFSPEAPRPVRLELLGDTVESIREFDARTQRSIAPVVRTTVLPLTEWAIPSDSMQSWDLPSYWGPKEESAQHTLFELSSSALKPIVFLDEPVAMMGSARKFLADATETYERHGQANSPTPDHFYWKEDDWQAALGGASQIRLEELALEGGDGKSFSVSSRPSGRFHGDVVACVGAIKAQLAEGGTVYLSAASTGELERLADISREYEVPYVLGESEDAAAGFTAEGAIESAALVLIRAP
ncbi:MAG: hypothetical protein JSS69_13970, partial [Acidobacteria bacterium]|nr:hypothetical protein [Acidobacteriota bacterium]